MTGNINVAGLSSSRKTPGIYMSVILGGPGASPGIGSIKSILLGNMIATTLTGSSPSFTVTAGTQQVSGTATETPTLLSDADDAATKFGKGSELHLMAKKFFDHYPDGILYGCPIAETGTKASATLTFVGSATSAGTVRIYINESVIDCPISTGDTVTTIATTVATYLRNLGEDLPTTAQFSSGVLTVTARNGGTRGNNIAFRASFINGNVEIPIATSTSQFGTAATITGSGRLTGGATDDNNTTALANIVNTRYHRYICACDDSANIGRVVTQLNTMSGVTSMLWQQAIFGTITSPATRESLAAASINSARCQYVGHENADNTTGEIAAAVCAARLAGDTINGGTLIGESTDPAANLDGLIVKLKSQYNPSDIPTPTEIESDLNSGVTPLMPGPNSNYSIVTRSITTRCKVGTSYNYSVLDTSNVTVTDYVAENIKSTLSVDYAGTKLANDPSDGTAPSIPNVVTPKSVKARIFTLLKGYESDGILTNVTEDYPRLSVVLDSNVVGRVNAEIPCRPIPGFHIFGANVRQLSN